MINDSVKKKIENIEKENEQASLKINRLEQDCLYYRARIEDFVVRIKNIINTQNKQVIFIDYLELISKEITNNAHPIEARAIHGRHS
jgi:hypothetical protein